MLGAYVARADAQEATDAAQIERGAAHYAKARFVRKGGVWSFDRVAKSSTS